MLLLGDELVHEELHSIGVLEVGAVQAALDGSDVKRSIDDSDAKIKDLDIHFILDAFS